MPCLAASEEQKIPLALPSFMKQPRLGTVEPTCRASRQKYLLDFFCMVPISMSEQVLGYNLLMRPIFIRQNVDLASGLHCLVIFQHNVYYISHWKDRKYRISMIARL